MKGEDIFMKNKNIRAFSIILAVAIFMITSQSYIEGKSIGAYKCTKYGEKGSDAKTIFNGVKEKGYSGTYLYAGKNKIKSSDFYDKSKTIKYWSSHGLPSGNLFGNAKYDVDFNVKKDFS
nr:hypothetical protein [Eubacterium sp.]